MATLTDLRDERTTNNSGDRVGTGLRSVGTRSTIPDEYDKHYSDTYGTTLSNSQLNTLNENQSKFNTSISTAKDELNTKTTEIEGLYNTNKSKLSSALESLPTSFDEYNTPELYDSTYAAVLEARWGRTYAAMLAAQEGRGHGGNVAPKSKEAEAIIKDQYIDKLKSSEGFNTFYNDWLNENAVKVTVVNPNDPSKKKEYMVDKETAYNNVATIDFKGYGGIIKRSDGSILISSDTYADKVNYSLANYSRELAIGLGEAYLPAAKTSITDGLNSLEGEYSLALDSLASRQKQIGMYEDENTSALNTIRAAYSNKLSSIKDTINSLIHG